MSSSSSSDPSMRVPMLASASSNGLTHALWRPQMITFLMRQGVEERDYTKEIPHWAALVKAVGDQAVNEEDDAVAHFLAKVKTTQPAAAEATVTVTGSSSVSSTSASVTVKKDAAQIVAEKEETEKKAKVSAMLGRVRKAYGYLFAALPSDVRLLVASVPQGYAYGVWDFLEKRYRNTEQDSIAGLWSNFISLAQSGDENFDEYKARVDSVVELLALAEDKPSHNLYCYALLWKLQPRYETAVLTLKTGDRLKNPAKIDWTAIAEYMSQYERSQQSLTGETGGDRVMAARGPGRVPTTSSGPGKSMSSRPAGPPASTRKSASSSSTGSAHVQCYNCQGMGHYASKCPKPNPRRDKQKRNGRPSKGGTKPGQASWSGSKTHSSSSEDEVEEPKSKRAHLARKSNRYDSLSEESDEDSPAPRGAEKSGRSYAAVLMATSLSLAPASARISESSSARRPGPGPEKAEVVNALTKSQIKRRRRQNRRLESSGSESDSEESDSSADIRGRAPGPAPKEMPGAAAGPGKVDLDAALRNEYKAVDTAASVSTCTSRKALRNVRRCKPVPIRMANGAIVSAMYKGDLDLRLRVAGATDKFEIVTIPDVYYHERFDANLLSWGVMKKLGWGLHSSAPRTYLVTPSGKETDAICRGNLTILEDVASARVYGMLTGPGAMSTSPTRSFVCKTAKEVIQLHRRLGHVSWTRLTEMSKTGASVGMPDLGQMTKDEREKAQEAIQECPACIAAKAHRKPLGHHGLDKGQRPGDVLHMDNFYIVTRDPASGQKQTTHCLLAVDAYTEWRWMDSRKKRSDLPQAAIDIIKHCHTMTGRYPRLVICDLGSEFANHQLESFARECGFAVQPSPARAKELNGLAEKNGDTAKKHVLAMMHGAKMEPEFGWLHAIKHFVYVWNRSHVGQHTQTTPYQAMTGREASVLNIGEFGCDVFVHQHRSQRDVTFSPKSLPAIYLGHDGRMNCPLVRMLGSGKIILSKDVHFREGHFSHLRATMKGLESEVPLLEVTVEDPSEPAAEQKYPESEQKWELKAVTDSRMKEGVREYRCQWVGDYNDTWEPASQIEHDVPDLVKEYEQSAAATASAAAAAQPVKRTSSEAQAPRRPSTRSTTASSRSKTSTAAAGTAAAPPAAQSSHSDVEDEDADSDHGSDLSQAAAHAARCL